MACKRMVIGDVLDDMLTTADKIRTMVERPDGTTLVQAILDYMDTQVTMLRVLKELAELTGHADEQIDVEDGE